jgi:hypothetical protein
VRQTERQRAERVFRFLYALRSQQIVGILMEHGFGDADLDEGWSLLRQVSRRSVAGCQLSAAGILQEVHAQLDAWQNRWRPIVDATLRRRAPAIHEALLDGVKIERGGRAAVSVGVLLQRYRELPRMRQAAVKNARPEAMRLLAQRGFTEAVAAEGERLCAAVMRGAPAPPVDPEAAGFAGADRALWAYYLEWSRIARAAIKDRRLLRRLGFALGEGASDDGGAGDAPAEPAEASGD